MIGKRLFATTLAALLFGAVAAPCMTMEGCEPPPAQESHCEPTGPTLDVACCCDGADSTATDAMRPAGAHQVSPAAPALVARTSHGPRVDRLPEPPPPAPPGALQTSLCISLT